MGQGSERGLCSSRCPAPGMCLWSGAGVDVETHMHVPLIPPRLSPTKDETQQQSCQGNNIEKRQFKERELYFSLLMFLFKTVHSTSIGLFCSVIYRGAAARWSVCKRQMQLGMGNNWELYLWSDPCMLTEGSRKPVAFHGLWIRSTARTHLSTGRWDLPFTHWQWDLTKPTRVAHVESLQYFIHPACFESCCGNTVHGFLLHPALLPERPFLNSCKEPHVGRQHGPRALAACTAQIPATWSSTPAAPNFSGDVRGTWCYFAEDKTRWNHPVILPQFSRL